jgi:hypothetical protein
VIEGWHNEEYLILFEDPNEASSMSDRYAVATAFPDLTLIGLRNWDDFILCDAAGNLFTVPTVPLIREKLRPLTAKFDAAKLEPDLRYADRIKWYIQPLVFGGSPTAQQNMTWLSFEQHTAAVKWWNDKYRELKGV